MKKTAIIISLLAAMTTIGTANAANSHATLKIKGKIVPPTCDINFDGGNSASLDMGKVNPGLLSDNEFSPLPYLTANLNITCPAATGVGFTATDLAAGAGKVTLLGADANGLFSLGLAKNGKTVGGYLVNLKSATVDQTTVTNFLYREGSGSWNRSPVGMTDVDPTGQKVYSWGASNNDVPTGASRHQVQLEIRPVINAMKELGNTDNIELSGEATYDLVYL